MSESARPVNTSARLDKANQAGKGLVWAGLILGLLWWAASAFGLYALNQTSPVVNQPIGIWIAAAALIILPGLIIIFAGFMARQTRRTHEANVLLLEASQALLTPAQSATEEIRNLAEATRHSTILINGASASALASLKETNEEMAKERMRAESVGYAMADNARDLTQRLAEERAALEKLSRALSEQVLSMGDALPKQAAAMQEATEQAKQDVAKTDAELATRIEAIKKASSTLATRLLDLDAIARDAAGRADALQTTITRIESRLSQTHKTVEMAERASTMAVDAAAQTSDALQNAVSTALDGARDANREIAEKTRLIQDSSRQAMEDLHKTGVLAASAAARVQEQARGIATDAPPPPPVPETQLQSQLQKPETAQISAADIQKFEAANTPAPRPRKSPTIKEISLPSAAKRPVKTRRVYHDEIDPVADTRPQAQDDDLFEAQEATLAQDTHGNAQPAITLTKENPQIPPLELGSIDSPILLNQAAIDKPAPSGAQGHQWRDIIADISETPDPLEARAQQQKKTAHSAQLPLREETANELMSRLQSSGIPLPTAIRHKDKKKIAAAARKDDQARRHAIRSAAGGEVDRVYNRLRKDDQLFNLAQRFVDAEKSEALKALDDTSHSRRHASARLSAYLLVDAALAPMLRH